MAYNLGSAYIQVVPSSKGFGKSLEKELGGVGAGASKSVSGKLFGGLKLAAVGAGGAIAGVLGGSIAKGFNRLKDIENAEAKLTGLGHSAETVEKVMGNALASVKGTAFGLGDAASLAGTLVASGIKPGKDLEKTLKLTADSATIAGRELGDMGLIWGSVAAKGKLQGDDAMQLLSSGVPIWQMVGDVMGKTAGEAQELGSKGQVSFEIFQKAMEKGVGGAALESGKTTEGAFKNMGAAMGRFGATLLKDVYPLLGPLFGKITDLFDYLEGAAGPAIESVTAKFKEWAASDQVQTMLGTLRDVGLALYDRVLKPLGTWIADNWKPIALVVGGIAAAFAGGALIGAVTAVGAAIGGIFTVATVVTTAIGAAVGGLTYFFTQTETGKRGIGALVGYFQGTVLPAFERFRAFVVAVLVPGIVGGFQLVRDFVVNELWPMIQSRFNAIKDLAVQVWQGVIQPAFAQFAAYVRDTMMPIIQRLWTEYVQPAFTAIGGLAVWLWNSAIKPAMSALNTFISTVLGPVIVWLWQNVVSPTFSAIGKFIGWVWSTLIFPALDALKYFVTQVIPPAFKFLWDTAKTVWAGIQSAIGAVVGWFKTWVWPVIELVIGLVKAAFGVLRDTLTTVWGTIKSNVIEPVVNWFKNTAWPILSSAIDSIKTGFNNLKDGLKSAWDTIRNNIIQPAVDWFKNTVAPLFKDSTQGVSDSFGTMKDAIKKAWDGVKEVAKAPIKFVVETAINSALIGNFNKIADKLGTTKLPTVSLPSGFARGGVLPGQSRMRDGDDQLVPMRRGEGVLVSEGLRTPADRAAFLAANAAGRRGVGFSKYMQGGFAGGGIFDKIKDVAGDTWDGITAAGGFIADAIADPKKAFKSLVDGFVGDVPGGATMREMATAVPKRMADDIASKLTGALSGVTGSTGTVPQNGAAGTGWGRASNAASSLGLTMTSGNRPGARTAGSGSVSLHAQGRARDYAGSASAMRAFFNAMDAAPYPTELLYSPMGGRNIHRGGRRYANKGATLKNHYNHVHVGFSEGGWTGPGSKHQPAGVVHADEFVMSKSARRSIEAARPGLLDRLNAMGAAGLAGYARGGLVKGYASGGKVSGSGKVGKVSVADVLSGLLGTPKQVRSAADKLAAQVTSAFKATASGSKKSQVNRLSDQLESLRKKASALTKASKETVKVTSKIGMTKGRKNAKGGWITEPKAITKSSKVTTAAAKSAASQLKGVQAQIEAAQAKLKKARRGDTSGVAEAKSASYEAGVLAGRTLKLTAYANTREKLAARIKSATEALNDAVKVRDDYSASMQEKLAGTFGITSESTRMGISGITQGFQGAVDKIGKLNVRLKRLSNMGLPDGLVDQIAQLGAADGSVVAGNLLQGSKAQIDRLGAWFKKSQSAAKNVSSSMAGRMYGAGVDAAKGLVNGLNSQLKAVNGAAQKVADSLVKTVRKTLKIHSPSRVFREIGEFTGAGMALGIDDSTPVVQSAMRSMVEPPRADLGYAASASVSGSGSSAVSLSDDDRALLRAIAEAVDLKVDGRSVVRTVRDSFKGERMPLVTA